MQEPTRNRACRRSAPTSMTTSTTTPTSTPPSRRRSGPTAPGQAARTTLASVAGHHHSQRVRQRLLHQRPAVPEPRGGCCIRTRRQELFNNGCTDSTVRNFASSASAFNSALATGMVKMGNLSPQIGTQGQIRLSCWKVNSS
jgi:hypothetical protein